MDQVLLTVSGRVQGVFFRDESRKTALALNLTGYAKNLENGDVEILVQGEKENIREFIKWASEGPSSAQVAHLSQDWSVEAAKLEGFKTY